MIMIIIVSAIPANCAGSFCISAQRLSKVTDTELILEDSCREREELVFLADSEVLRLQKKRVGIPVDDPEARDTKYVMR